MKSRILLSIIVASMTGYVSPLLAKQNSIPFSGNKTPHDTKNFSDQNVESLLSAFLVQNQNGIIQNNPQNAHYLLNRHLVFSALATGDLGFSSRAPSKELLSQGRFDGTDSVSAALTNILLFADAKIIHGLTVHTAGLYQNNHQRFQRYDQDNGLSANWDSAGNLQTPRYERPDFMLDEAYIRYADFQKTPLFFEGGRFYMPFGNYELHPLRQTLPQQLAQTQGDGAELGVAYPISPKWGQIAITAYGFKGAEKPPVSRYRDDTDFGTQIAYKKSNEAYGYQIDLGYLYNMNLVDYISTSTPDYAATSNKTKVGALALDWLAHAGPFDTHLNFVSALRRFNPQDIDFHEDEGAVPKAIDVGTGYRFDVFQHDSHMEISYQHSWQAANVAVGSVIEGAGLPKSRVEGDYTINLWSAVNLGLQLGYDKDYSEDNSGSGRDAVTGMVRFEVGMM